MLARPGLYIHFPWCVRKCPYCDFNSHPLREQDDFGAYIHALIADWQSQSQEHAPSFASVFLGGGTPSLFPPEQIAQVLQQLPIADDAEVTMEANPGTTERADFAGYKDAGVNRLSIGAQSFNAHHLNRLGRIHGPEEIVHAVADAKQAGFSRINLDLMWGLPQQNIDQALGDLEQAIALGPDHISWYQLTLEPHTEFAQRPPQLPMEDVLVEIETAGLSLLQQYGFERYEVSAFARPNQQCQHNLNYWRFGDYIGIGAGAHGKLSNHGQILRTHKPKQPRLYQRDPIATITQPVADEERVFEFMLNALRLVEGVSVARLLECTGRSFDEIQPTWSDLVERGLVRNDRIATTTLGYRYLDSVVGEFLS